MSERATCWSITVNNPKDEDLNAVRLEPGWKLSGQIEKGAEGTEHYQGVLTTPQVRFSAIKKAFPRAHIEVCRNRKALEQYVHKEDTRVRQVADITSLVPTQWDYVHRVANLFEHDDYVWHLKNEGLQDDDKGFMSYIDQLVKNDICAGKRGVEFIAINPMWRSAWKTFGREIIQRERLLRSQAEGGASPEANAPPAFDIPSDSENQVVEKESPHVL